MAAALLGGCAAPLQSSGLLSAPPPRFVEAVELEQVPFFPQERFQCGPAALATVLVWSGIEIRPDDLTSEVYIPRRHGSLQVELTAAARRHGRVPYVLARDVPAVLSEIQAGHPVVVLLNLGLSWYPRWHYAVVVGYDLAHDRLLMRSGTERRDVISLETFERTWNRGNRWAMVVMSPAQLPATAQELPYLRAVLPFEQLHDWRTASAAYATAWRRWPESIAAAMGVGNSAYAVGDLESAAETYRQVLTRQPDYAPALNNLAQILMDRGDPAAAEQYARRAISTGGPQTSVYEETLREILEKTAH